MELSLALFQSHLREEYMKKKQKIVLLSIMTIFIAFCISSVIFIKTQVTAVDKNSDECIKVEIPSGTSTKELASLLKKKNLIKNETIFYLCARFPIFHKFATGKNTPFILKSGVYNLSKNLNIDQMFDILKSGMQDYIVISIPEGLTLSKIAKKLEESGVCNKTDFINACSNSNILEKYGIKNELGRCEGFLFPDTYYFTPSMDATVVVETMIKNFFEKVKNIKNIPLNDIEKLNQTIILASIIEREYRRKDEATKISSVFHNRLKIGMGLYSCATVEYIITEILGKEHPNKITYEDLKLESPYNTYKWAGLPPGAISNPGKTAINAALNPDKTKYLYFRLVDTENGKHVFTSEFSDHINERPKSH